MRNKKVTLKSGKEFLICFSDNKDFFLDVSVLHNELTVFSYQTYYGQMNKRLAWNLKYSKWHNDIKESEKEELIDYIIKFSFSGARIIQTLIKE